MNDEKNVLKHGQRFRAPDVGHENYEHHGKHEECPLPVFSVVVRVVDGDEPLDDGSREEGSRCGASLPGESRHPPGHIAQDFLVLGRRKLRNPMVLATACGGPTSGQTIIPGKLALSTHIEAISARHIMTTPKPRKVQTYDQSRPAIPPSTSPWVLALEAMVSLNCCIYGR
jgi:hypothetical protein